MLYEYPLYKHEGKGERYLRRRNSVNLNGLPQNITNIDKNHECWASSQQEKSNQLSIQGKPNQWKPNGHQDKIQKLILTRWPI